MCFLCCYYCEDFTLVCDFEVTRHTCSTVRLAEMQCLQVIWFFVKFILARNFLVNLLFFNGMFKFLGLVENFHGQPMIFLPWIVRGYVSVWVNMHFILVDILISLQSYFQFCLLYRVFIERRVKLATTVCDLFRNLVLLPLL